jgi:hypothetical protein
LKQDGDGGIDGPTGMTMVIENYLNYDMVKFDIHNCEVLGKAYLKFVIIHV